MTEHAHQLERIARLEDGIQRLNAFLGGGTELTETHYRAFRGLNAMRSQLPELCTPKPWPPGTRFTKLNYKAGVLRTYRVVTKGGNLVFCVRTDDLRSECSFAVAELDRYEMQGVVKRLP